MDSSSNVTNALIISFRSSHSLKRVKASHSRHHEIIQSLDCNLSSSSDKTLEATLGSNLLLQLDHSLLVTARVGRVRVESPGEVLVGVVGHEAWVKDTQTLAVVGDLVPVTVDVLQVTTEVGVRALEDLAVDWGTHDGLDVDVFLVCLLGRGENVVGGALDGTHELADLILVGSQEGVVGDVQNGAEAAAAQFRELVDTEHLHVISGTVLGSQPVGQLDHLHVLQANTGGNVATDEGLGNVHAAADGSVVLGSHAVGLGEFVDLNLHLIPSAFAQYLKTLVKPTFPNSPT